MDKTEGIVSSHYLGEQGKTYFDHHFGENMAFGRMFQTRYFRPFCSEKSVLLDFGCNDGLFLRNLPAKRRIGVEVNRYALEACSKLIAEIGIPIDLHESLETVPENSVDVVISNHVLEHVTNPLEILRQVRRVLRPGGTFILVTPFDDFRSSQYRNWQSCDRDHHLFTWGPLNLGNLVTEAGFEVNESRICTSAWSPKFFWIHKLFGLTTFKIACFLFAILRNRREVFCRAVNRKEEQNTNMTSA